MYTSFTIENFRLFDHLTVAPLSRVNLIAGQNNAGKTALLEALWLHTGQNGPELAQRINIWRGLPGGEPGGLFLDLFLDYQPNSPIKLTASLNGDGDAGTLTITYKPRTERTTPMASPLAAGPQTRRTSLESILDNEIAFDFIDGDGKEFPSRVWVEARPLPFDVPMPPGVTFDGNLATLRVERVSNSPDRKSSIFMQSAGRVTSQELSARFGKAEIAGHLDDVQKVLKFVEPRLKRLTAVPIAEGPALIYGDIGAKRIIPVALMGGGFVRLLELTLAFVEVQNGSILIDEIENGLHHSVLQDVWQSINQLSQKFNVQVFATTHSYECIVAANNAFTELESDELHLHRLYRRDGRVKAVTYDKEALNTNIEYLWEVR